MIPLFKHTPLGGWSPLNEDGVDGGTIRLYTSDRGVTTDGSDTRVRAGVQCYPTNIKAWWMVTASPDALRPVDGQGFFELDDGRFLLIGGAPQGKGIDSCNTVWKSDDRGRSWQVLLLAEQDRDADPEDVGDYDRVDEPVTRFVRGHTLGFLTHVYDDVKYCYVIGGDPTMGANGEVWRTPTSGNGTVWTKVSDTAPLVEDNTPIPPLPPIKDRTLFLCWSLNGKMYIGGGQPDAATAEGDPTVYESADGGATWSYSGDAFLMPSPGVSQVLGQLPEIDGEVYLVGGGTNQDPAGMPDDNYWTNAVHKFHPTNGWTQILEHENHLPDPPGEQFPPCRYHSVVREVNSQRLWKFNGSTPSAGDTSYVHFSDDKGETWLPFTAIPWISDPTHAQAALASHDGVYVTHGFSTDKLYVIRSEKGGLVTQWRDQGGDGLHLEQSDPALQPLLVPKIFGGRPGVVAHGGQIMVLDDENLDTVGDDAISTGGFEAWVIVRSLNFDESSESCILVGSTKGNSQCHLALNGGQLEFRYVTQGGTLKTVATTNLNDDRPHLVGVQFYPPEVENDPSIARLFVDPDDGEDEDTELKNIADNDPTFSEVNTGWNSIFGGGLGVENNDGNASAAIGALVVRRGGAQPWGASIVKKLYAWSRAWGVGA